MRSLTERTPADIIRALSAGETCWTERRRGRVAEGTSLLRMHTAYTCIVGSNPTVSARFKKKATARWLFSLVHRYPPMARPVRSPLLSKLKAPSHARRSISLLMVNCVDAWSDALHTGNADEGHNAGLNCSRRPDGPGDKNWSPEFRADPQARGDRLTGNNRYWLPLARSGLASPPCSAGTYRSTTKCSTAAPPYCFRRTPDLQFRSAVDLPGT